MNGSATLAPGRTFTMVDSVALPVNKVPSVAMAVVAAPAYLQTHPAPASPEDLAAHACIELRLLSSGLQRVIVPHCLRTGGMNASQTLSLVTPSQKSSVPWGIFLPSVSEHTAWHRKPPQLENPCHSHSGR